MIELIHLRFLLFITLPLFGHSEAFRSTTEPSIDCSKWRELFDSGSAILSMAGDLEDTPIPPTMEAMEKSYCKRHLDTTVFMKEIARLCLKPFPKQVAGMAIHAARREIKRQCNDRSEKEKLFKSMACLRNQQAKRVSINLYRKLIRSIVYARDFIGNETLQIPYTCCSHHEFVTLSKERLLAAGCKADDVDYVIKSNENKVKESMDLVCSNWPQGSEKCANLLSQHPIDNDVLKSVQLPKSNVLPLVDILTGMSLPE